jgi:hypothetical protein
MYTEAELSDDFEAVDADECSEMRRAAELGYSLESLSDHFEFDEETLRHHLEDECTHY